MPQTKSKEAERYKTKDVHISQSTEAERYRRAAEEALQQLDWCIGYLHGIRKTQLSSRLAKNREFIKRSLMKESTAPTPTSTTSES